MANLEVSPATPINIPLERSLYVGNTLRGILFGIEIFTFFAAVYCISHRSPDHYRKSEKLYVVYGGILLVLVTIEVVPEALWCQYMWIDHRNYPGGPLGFYRASQSTWYGTLGFAADAMANILGDGLLVYRCFIIWRSRWRIIAIPALIYLASSGVPNVIRVVRLVEQLIVRPSGSPPAVLAVIAVVERALPGTSLLNGKPTHLTAIWVSLSVGLNVIVTSMICFRLWRMRTLMREILAPEMSRMYLSVVAMLIESAAPLSILGICLVVTAAQNRPLTFAFGYVWSMFCSLSPQMIILRVAMGHGWLKETVNEINATSAFVAPTMIDA